MSRAGATTRYSECLSASWLAERLGLEKSRIDAMRRAGELIAVRPDGETEWLYPAWQLDGRAPRKVVARLVAVARDAGLDEDELYDALTAERGLVTKSRLVDLLVAGQDEAVLATVRASGRS